jgi:hypothetical protein
MNIKDVYTTVPEAGFEAARRAPSRTAIARFFDSIRSAYECAGLDVPQYMGKQRQPGIEDDDSRLQVFMLERKRIGAVLGNVIAGPVVGINPSAEMQLAAQNGNYTGTNGLYWSDIGRERSFQLTKCNLSNLTGYIMEMSQAGLFVPTEPRTLALPNRLS